MAEKIYRSSGWGRTQVGKIEGNTIYSCDASEYGTNVGYISGIQIYHKNNTPAGHFKNGCVYDNHDRPIGNYEGGKVYKEDRYSRYQIGEYSGGPACAAALLLLL